MRRASRRPHRVLLAQLVLVAMGLALAMLWLVRVGFDLRMAALLALGPVFAAATLWNPSSRWSIFRATVWLLAVGQRSVHLGKDTWVVPSEGLIIALAVVLALGARPSRGQVRRGVPPALSIVVLWAVASAALRVASREPLDAALSWVLPYVAGWCVFFVLGRLVTASRDLTVLIRDMLIATSLVGLLANVEHFIPAVRFALPWFFAPKDAEAQGGFVRAAFGAFGYPSAAAVVLWALFLAWDELRAARRALALMAFAVVGASAVVAVAISGQRSSWLALVLALPLLLLRKGVVRTVPYLGVAALAAGIPLAHRADEFIQRSGTVSDLADTGRTRDTSLEQRFDRWRWGLTSASESPLTGVGFGQRLVHNAVLEVAAKIGLIPALAFVVFLLQVTWRCVSGFLPGPNRGPPSPYRWAFAAILPGLVIQWMSEAQFQTPPLAMFYWFMMALIWYSYNTQPGSRQHTHRGALPNDQGQSDGTSADVQLRGHCAGHSRVGEVGRSDTGR